MTYIVPYKNTFSDVVDSVVYEQSYFNNLLSSDALDESYPEWDTSTTYTKDTYVKVSSLKRIYRLADVNSLAEYPPANPSKWVDYGTVNTYKMFDEIVLTQTSFSESMTIEIEANNIDSVSFLNMDAVSSVRVVQTDLTTSDVLYDSTYDLLGYGVLSLYDYWYKPVRVMRDINITDLHVIQNAKLTITFSSNGTGKIGACVSGQSDNLGLTLYGSKVKLKDYSKYSTDEYGNTSFVKRGYARVITGQVALDTVYIDEVISKVAELRGKVTLFIGDERQYGYVALTTLGYIEDLELEISNPTKTKYPIKIIGVI